MPAQHQQRRQRRHGVWVGGVALLVCASLCVLAAAKAPPPPPPASDTGIRARKPLIRPPQQPSPQGAAQGGEAQQPPLQQPPPLQRQGPPQPMAEQKEASDRARGRGDDGGDGARGGFLHVVKRDGRREPVAFDKITRRLRCVGIPALTSNRTDGLID
jgi:type IV secretory pathway VirB10-like protein